MYHVIGTGITAVLLYFISYFFCRIGYYSQNIHRKIWNSILTVVFLVTAFAGILLALQVSYKWNIPVIKSILKWHVEFGIATAFAGIFHFLWHLSYFGKYFTKSENINIHDNLPEITAREVGTNLFIIGFVSTSVQILLIREVLNISGGYELIAGTFLCSWLALSALGAFMAGKSALNDIRKINIIFSSGPIVSILLLLLLSRVILFPGETPSFLASIVYTLIVLLPFCVVSGFTFAKLLTIASKVVSFIPGKSFSIETAGGIASGIIVSSLTSGVLNTYQVMFVIIILANSYVLVKWLITGKWLRIAVITCSFLLITIVIAFNTDALFRQILMPGITVKETRDTPYGNITTGTFKGEESLFYNNRIISYKNDVAEREENIHYAMLQCESPGKVILVSGSLRSHLPEILKYPVREITCIERDPALSKLESQIPDPLSARVTIENNDAFTFIRNNPDKADVVILLTPPPSTLLLNRYFTAEFFNQVKLKLNKCGVFMCSPGQYDNYLNNLSVKLNSSVYNSLKGIFKNVIAIAGNKLYFIASDKELSTEICHLAEMKKINNTYVSPDFMSDDLITQKSNEVISLMDLTIRQNKLAFPVACFYYQSYNLSKHINEKVPAFIMLFLIFAIPLMGIRRENLIMYFSASALAGFEMIILLTLQLIAGNMYQLTGIIIAGLMAGLAIGANTTVVFFKTSIIRKEVVLLFCFYIIFALFVNYLLEIKSVWLAVSLLVISIFLPALFTGNIFNNLTNSAGNTDLSSSTYSSDLAGSSFGLIMVAGLVLPLFGIKNAIFVLSAFVLSGILFGTVKNK